MRETLPTTVGKFTTGSILRHVIVMTATTSVGLTATFIVDMLSIFYIARLGHQEFTAAIGFVSTLMFFTLSVCLGLTIPTTALVARSLGHRDRRSAAEIGGAAMIFMALVTVFVMFAVWPFLRPLLYALGARGETLEYAKRFLDIAMPSIPLVGLGMCVTGILRGAGDARLAMYVPLVSAGAAAILDPLLIFALGLGLDGAAIATVIARGVMLAVGWYGVHKVHRMIALPPRRRLELASKPFFEIAVPATLAQLATPVANAYLMGVLARLGNDAVAGMAVVGRLVPVVFVALFALSGAIGPIFAQNLSARRYARIFETIRVSLALSAAYVMIVWVLMMIFAQQIADLFDVHANARDVVEFFCWYLAGTYLFVGAVVIASAAFDSLGFPRHSTALNWARGTIGAFPFVSLGASYYGVEGALAGSAVGIVVFGIISVIWCYWIVNRVVAEDVTKQSVCSTSAHFDSTGRATPDCQAKCSPSGPR